MQEPRNVLHTGLVQGVREPLIAPAPLIEILRALPRAPEDLDRLLRLHRRDAERHGLGGVLFDGDASVEAAARSVARELDHQAHLEMISRIDRVFASAGIRAVTLKGALLAERLYPRPSTRGTTDIDLLVAEKDLDRAAESLGALGYSLSTAPEEARFRREHHHVHMEHADALPLELHFHAYRGFGSVLSGAELVARAVPFADLEAVHVLAPEDELLYLMVHAAAHRFGRLSWLYDIKLLLATMSDAQIRAAAARAKDTGFERVVSVAAAFAVDLAGVPRHRLAPLLGERTIRHAVSAAVAPEPENALLRAATRFVYTSALCPNAGATARYAVTATVGYARRMLASRA